MKYVEVTPKETIMGRLTHAADLLTELTQVCRERSVFVGRVEAIGAVQTACVGFYDQAARSYSFQTIDRPMEIVGLKGNVSLKDGEPFVHAHISLVDSDGQCYGGHLAEGTTVFACEFVIAAFDGPVFDRQPDEPTGLALWSLESDLG